MDPEIRNEVWDARVKIVYGRFIINTFSFMFAYLFVGIIVMNQAFKGNENVARFIVLLGLVLAFLVFVVSFLVDFKPKMKKISALLEHLSIYKLKSLECGIPSDATIARSFIANDTYEIKKDIFYHIWIDKGSMFLFPYKPTIEELDHYLENQVPYVLIEIPDVDQFSMKPSGSKTYDHVVYRNKKLVMEKITINTSSVVFANQTTGIFDERILALLNHEVKHIESDQLAQVNQEVRTNDEVKLKLEKLKKLHDENLITDEEYQTKRQEVINRL